MLKPLTAALLLVIVMSGCGIPSVSHDASYWTGFVIIWGIVLVACIVLILFAGAFLWYRVFRKLWINDWFAYNIRRKKIDTELLQYGYRHYNMNTYWKRQTFKYRLRNIQSASKGNCSNPIHKAK